MPTQCCRFSYNHRVVKSYVLHAIQESLQYKYSHSHHCFFFNNSPSVPNGKIKKNFIYKNKTDALLSFFSFSSRTCRKPQLQHTNKSLQGRLWVRASFGSDLTSLPLYSFRNNQCASFTLQVLRKKLLLRGKAVTACP